MAKFSGVRWQVPRGSAPTAPALDSLSLYADNTTGLPAYITPDSQSVILTPNRVLISSLTTPNDSGGFNIDVSGAPATDCLHLEIFVALRGTVSATFELAYIFFNNDTTVANYRYSVLSWSEAAANPAAAGSAIPRIMTTTAASSPTNEYSFGRILVPFFRATTFAHHARVHGNNFATGASSIGGTEAETRWTGVTTAITNIKIRTDNHPTDTWTSNSSVIVVGHTI